MEELKRLLRHFAPVVAVWVIAKYGLPAAIQAPLVAFLGELADLFAAAIAGAFGYLWSLFRRVRNG